MLRSLIILALASGVANAQPEPTGKHPRILLDDGLRASWKKQAGDKSGAVAKAIGRCEATRREPKEFQRDSYMGFDWSASAAACLISWVVRGKDEDASSAMIFVAALLDDLDHIGDGKGGEKAVHRDTGYAIRSMPPYVALAYDWLYDHPVMTPAFKQRIRERLESWISWDRKSGYHNHTLGTNFHAGSVWSTTLTAIALAGENDEVVTSLWNHVRDVIWAKDMAKMLGPGGILEGGDFPEGWQYAPLSVAEYSLIARIASQQGIAIDGTEAWLSSMFVRTVHARSGSRDTIAAVGDTDEPVASIAVSPMTLLAFLVGPASAITQREAAAEKLRLGLVSKDQFLFEALAQARAVVPGAAPIATWPTSYYAPGVHTFYARTTWAPEGVWLQTICMGTPNQDADHMAPNAGNVVVTRGTDEVIIDPTPYGSMSTLTSNAPTVDSKQQVATYRPSQAPWGETTHFAWALQTATGVVATRCDYADQYKFQDRASDVDLATRDLVLIPWGKKLGDASIVVIDRATTGHADLAMYLRFRSPAKLALANNVATAKVGASTLAIHKIIPVSEQGEVRQPAVDACWKVDRGKCDSTRIPTGEYRITIPGPAPESIHVIDVSGGDLLAVDTPAFGVTHLIRGAQHAYVATKPGSYTATPAAGAIHIATDGKATVTKLGTSCKIDVTSEDVKQPAVLVVDADCKSTEDPQIGPAAPGQAGSGALIPVSTVPQRGKTRGGCCDAGGDLGTSLVAMLLVVALLRTRHSSTP